MTDGAEVDDVLAALGRLAHRHKVLTLDQARAAARIVTGNPDYELPAEPAQAPVPGAPPAPAPAPAPPTDNASPAGSENL